MSTKEDRQMQKDLEMRYAQLGVEVKAMREKFDAKQGPVVVAVGDTVVCDGDDCTIGAPGADNEGSVAVSFRVNKNWLRSRNLSRMWTPDGRAISGVVPFRVTKSAAGRHYCGSLGFCRETGSAGWRGMEYLGQKLEFASKTLYPWYTGPAYIIEDE